MPSPVKLSAAAEADFFDLISYGLAQHGEVQTLGYKKCITDTLATIELFPESFREEADLTPPQRVAPVGQHIILYEYDGAKIFVTRIRHHAEDWR